MVEEQSDAVYSMTFLTLASNIFSQKGAVWYVGRSHRSQFEYTHARIPCLLSVTLSPESRRVIHYGQRN